MDITKITPEYSFSQNTICIEFNGEDESIEVFYDAKTDSFKASVYVAREEDYNLSEEEITYLRGLVNKIENDRKIVNEFEDYLTKVEDDLREKIIELKSKVKGENTWDALDELKLQGVYEFTQRASWDFGNRKITA